MFNIMVKIYFRDICSITNLKIKVYSLVVILFSPKWQDSPIFFSFPKFFFFLVYTFFLNKIARFTALFFLMILSRFFLSSRHFFHLISQFFLSSRHFFFFPINGSHFIFYHIYIYITETFETPTIFHIIILIYKKN